MEHNSSEFFWLTLTALLTLFLSIPYVVYRIKSGKNFASVAKKQLPDAVLKAEWAQRAVRAHANAIENLVVVAPIVLMLHAKGISTSLTIGACTIHFFSRLMHAIVYILGVPFLRIAAFMVNIASTIMLGVILLKSVCII